MGKRAIVHVDLDAFFASVEQLENPKLKGKPVIVGGPANRGVVAAASYEARRFGLKAGMPIAKARRLCPHGIFISGNHYRYGQYSSQVRGILSRYTSQIEPLGLDEAFLDLTGCQRLLGPAPVLKIKKQIFEEVGLTISVGVAPNKFLAKLASQLDKPDGFVVITEENALQIIHPLPVSHIWGVGPRVTEELDRLGIRTIGELARTPLASLEALLGSYARTIHDFAWGKDERKIRSPSLAKSIGAERTFKEDIERKSDARHRLFQLTDKVGWRLRKERYLARFITIKIRFSDFKTITRRTSLANPTDVSDLLFQTAWSLTEKVAWRGRRIRLLGVSASGLLKTSYFEQLSLLEDSVDKKRRALLAVDKIKEKYGRESISRGGR